MSTCSNSPVWSAWYTGASLEEVIMEYTVVLTKKPNSQWHAVVPALPACEAEANTREEVLAQIKDEITQ